ncbi:hypothetical protein L6452_07983 [Arctium lappa]|uniref:Uncharacterized protein n=1 Tax=Arctium lappa TaxID=4217 RepID=A0ACB9DFZ8_ARCLA|nr:hypothetical protein L6452_07983 [Arctium lappa]
MEIVTAIVTPVVQSLIVPIKKQLGYLISCKTYVRDVGTKIKDLDGKRVNVEEHMNHNKRNNLVVPTEVRGWLEKVVKTDEKVESISSDVGSCFNLKRRHKIGRKAFKIIEEINRLIEENNMINWSDHRIPLGKVDSMKASTSTPSGGHNDFQSRERTFMEALKQLQPDHKSQMISLCGMGGVGKTTMMEKLKKLEELYMRVAKEKGIRFTHTNGEELVERSKNLFTLEIEFFDSNALPKNMSFKKLERFKISLGCYLKENDVQNRHSFENTLMLVTDKCELLDSRMNELFDKTEVLHFQVNGVNDLGDGLVESLHHRRSSFYNLRVLTICKCANLKYLFTVCVANSLKKLERLTISFCPVLETLVDEDNNGVGVIKFQALKFLSFGHLPKLMSLCNVVNAIELPQLEELILDSLPNFSSIYPDDKSATSSLSNDTSTIQPFLNKEVAIPQLKKLKVSKMERLKEIWPSNPMLLLHHLEELIVNNCGSIEVLFNIDLESVGNIEESSCCLRSIQLWELGNLREVWRIKGANNEGLTFSCFHAIENIEISDCKWFRNVFTPTTTNFDMRALTKLAIDRGERRIKRRQEQEINVMSREEISEVGDDISNVVFSSHLIHTTFHYVHTLLIEDHNREEVVFEIESPSSKELATTPQNKQQPLLPFLEDLELRYMERMSHVWKCNWNLFLNPQKQRLEESSSSFHNLTTISLWECKNMKYLFSPRMAKLLSNLKKIRILYCGIEELVSNRDDEDEEGVASTSTNTNSGLLSNLDYLDLQELPNLKLIGGSDSKTWSNETSLNIITPIHDQFKFPQTTKSHGFLLGEE